MIPSVKIGKIPKLPHEKCWNTYAYSVFNENLALQYTFIDSILILICFQEENETVEKYSKETAI